MSRPLPLTEASTPADVKPTFSGMVQVFDPAMCCSTGLCGPGVDPALLQISRDLRWLTAGGATVVRVGLSQEPQAFVANPRVAGLMQAFGDGALPAVLVNDVVLAHGRYPTRDELVTALAPSTAPAARGPLKVVAGDSACCAPGSDCC